MTTILVTGASGFVGSHVLPELLAAGYRVRALVRGDVARRTILRRLPEERRPALEFATGDVTEPSTLPQAVAGADVVVHLVAIARDRNGGRDLTRINTGGTENIIVAMRGARVRRLIHLGALGITDDPALRYASSKARGEKAVMQSGLEWTILKPSIMWGERDGFFNTLAALVRFSPLVVPLAGGGASRFQPIGVEDTARIVRLSLERPATAPGAYELGGPRYWTYREMVAEVLRSMGKHRVLLAMPVPLISLVAASAERVRLPFPVATDQLRQLAVDNVGPLGGVVNAFGFEPRDMGGQLDYLRRRARDQEPWSSSPSRA